MSTAALIAVKARAHAKSRLAGALDDSARIALVRTLLSRVLTAARRARGVDCVAVVSPQVEDLPEDCRVFTDDGSGHNTAVAHAIDRLTALGVTEVLILPADLDTVLPEDLEALLIAGRQAGAAIAPDHNGTGTNALYVRLPVQVPFGFGPDSCVFYRSAFRRAGIEPALVRRPGLAHDVDEPQDLARLYVLEARTCSNA